jgi:putative FmdB family regulatory protein
MPRWDFYCQECGAMYPDLSFATYEASQEAECPKCLAPLKRLPSAPGTFILKGKGFHKNDYPASNK